MSIVMDTGSERAKRLENIGLLQGGFSFLCSRLYQLFEFIK